MHKTLIALSLALVASVVQADGRVTSQPSGIEEPKPGIYKRVQSRIISLPAGMPLNEGDSYFAATDREFFYTDGRNTYVLDGDGNQVRVFRGLTGGLKAHNNKVYVVTHTALHRIDTQTGAILETYDLKGLGFLDAREIEKTGFESPKIKYFFRIGFNSESIFIEHSKNHGDETFLSSIDLKTHKLNWTQKIWRGGLSYYEHYIYEGIDKTFYDSRTGKEINGTNPEWNESPNDLPKRTGPCYRNYDGPSDHGLKCSFKNRYTLFDYLTPKDTPKGEVRRIWIQNMVWSRPYHPGEERQLYEQKQELINQILLGLKNRSSPIQKIPA